MSGRPRGLTALVSALLLGVPALAGEPAVKNLSFAQDSDRVVVHYDLEAHGPVPVRLVGSIDGGRTYALPVCAVTGDTGAAVAPGRGRTIEWAFRADHPQGLDQLDVTLDVVVRGDRYLPVPLRGRFGVELDEDYLKACLKLADAAEVGFLVFEVESPGGSVLEMEDMIDLLLEWREEHPTVRVVALGVGEVAHAAAYFVAAAADAVFLQPGAWLGAGAGPRPGGAEVAESDLAFPPELQRRIGALAERRGVSAALLDAVVRPCRLAAALAPGAGPRVVKIAGAVPPRHTLLADGAKPLRLSGSNAVLSGFAAGLVRDQQDLGRQLGHPAWASAGDAARNASRAFAADVARVLGDYESLSAMLREGFADAEAQRHEAGLAPDDAAELRELTDEISALAQAFPFVQARAEADLPGGMPGVRQRLVEMAAPSATAESAAPTRSASVRAPKARKRSEHVWTIPSYPVARS